jgi:hypothetical protein
MLCVRDKGGFYILFYIGFLVFLQVLTINYVLTELCMVDNADNFDFRMSDVSTTHSRTSQFGTLQIGPTKYCPERLGTREKARGYTR